jgi:hypothetical protein
MSEQKIPDFDETELNAVRAQLLTRYRKAIEPQQAEVELDLTGTGDLTWYPALFWSELGASFVVLKLDASAYRPLFYYQPDQQFGTGRDRYDDLDYDDLDDCVANLLRMQADHQKELAGASSGKTAKDLN